MIQVDLPETHALGDTETRRAAKWPWPPHSPLPASETVALGTLVLSPMGQTMPWKLSEGLLDEDS